jgi:hypothetical protein
MPSGIPGDDTTWSISSTPFILLSWNKVSAGIVPAAPAATLPLPICGILGGGGVAE